MLTRYIQSQSNLDSILMYALAAACLVGSIAIFIIAIKTDIDKDFSHKEISQAIIITIAGAMIGAGVGLQTVNRTCELTPDSLLKGMPKTSPMASFTSDIKVQAVKSGFSWKKFRMSYVPNQTITLTNLYQTNGYEAKNVKLGTIKQNGKNWFGPNKAQVASFLTKLWRF